MIARHRMSMPSVVGAVCLAFATLAAVAPPAGAADAPTPLHVTDSASWIAALATASDATETTPIVIDNDFTLALSAPEDVEYDGVAAVEIQGGGHTITGSAGASFIAVSSTVDVDVSSLTLTRFTSIAVAVWAGDYVNLVDVSLTDYSGADPSMGLWGETIVLDGGTYARNTSEAPGAAGYLAANRDIIISGVTATDNASEREGGAFYATGGAGVSVRSSTFRGNSAGTDGGAVFNAADVVVSERSTYEANSAVRLGGAVYAGDYGDSYETLWRGNSAGVAGGAIYSEGGDFTYGIASTYVGNTAPEGGAFFGATEGFDAQFSTFVGNSASSGAHVALDDGSLTSQGSVYADAAGSGAACVLSAGLSYTEYNFDDSGSCSDAGDGSTDFGLGMDPQLGALADNGGPTLTMMPSRTSPVLDAVPADRCTGSEGPIEPFVAETPSINDEPFPQPDVPGPVDQRGLPRILEVDAHGGGCDAGAVERVGTSSVTLTGPQGATVIDIEGSLGLASEDCAAAISLAEAGGTAPSDVAFRNGAFTFCANTGVPGAPVTVTVTLPAPANVAYKVDAGTWTAIPGATWSANGTVVTYTTQEGGPLDEDHARNAVFVDPFAAGFRAVFTG